MIFECNGQEANQDERITKIRQRCQNQIDILQTLLDATKDYTTARDVKLVVEGYIEGLTKFIEGTK